MDPPPRPSSTHSSRRPPSIAASYSKRNVPRVGGAYGFDAQDLYYFGVLSELTDKFTPVTRKKSLTLTLGFFRKKLLVLSGAILRPPIIVP